MSYDAYASQKDYEESQGIEPVTKVMAEALQDINHWCSRVGPTSYEDKFDYQLRQDQTQR